MKPVRPNHRGPSFAFQALRLVGSILLEGITTLFHLVLFPLHRAAERDRIRKIIFRAPEGLGVLATIGILAFTGCQSAAPGSTFTMQVDELAWSAKEMVRMDDAQQSLEDDLSDFGAGISPREMIWDLEQIFRSPDAQGSLEDDLHDLGDLDLSEIPETFELLGW